MSCIERYDQPRSARSSASSAQPHPLTPVYELALAEEMAILSSSGSSDRDDEDEEGEEGTTGRRLPKLSPALPSSSFTFGTCPSRPLQATPTFELGPFDYPIQASASTSTYNPPGSPTARKQSLALGMTHRRASIVTRSSPVDQHSTFPSPPPSRRSSTCSTITTLPIAGARPSILHSASTTSGQAILPSLHSPNSSRRSSIMFPQKQLATPIPPSLLARRGSLPVSKLFAEEKGPSRFRASIAGGGPNGWTTTTSQLYRRRESVMSDGGDSQSSGKTVKEGFDSGALSQAPRRGSVFSGVDLESLQRAHLSSTRRSSHPENSSQPDLNPMDNGDSIPPHSHLARPSLTSSSESEESDEAEQLPTPGTASTFDGFTDPWANSIAAKGDGIAAQETTDDGDETPKAG